MTLPDEMLKPRKAAAVNCSAAWYYINKGSIDVLYTNHASGLGYARLTRKQLQRALEIMDTHRSTDSK